MSITWSRRRCIHVAACVLRLPKVFAPGRRPWVDATQASAEAIARVVQRCPTGALHFERQDGVVEEPPETNTVLVARHGPLYLHGRIEVLDESGTVRLVDTRVALCRCGQSQNKPLCDGGHLESRFQDDGVIAERDSAESAESQAGATLRVSPEPGGPLRLEGPFRLVSADRRSTVPGVGARLCRCGDSGTKPFCDGSHEQGATSG